MSASPIHEPQPVLGHQHLLTMAVESVRSFVWAFPARNSGKENMHPLGFVLPTLNRLSVNTLLLSRQLLTVHLEPICSHAAPNPVSASVQLNISCTRCSERCSYHPQDQQVLSEHCTFLYMFIQLTKLCLNL